MKASFLLYIRILPANITDYRLRLLYATTFEFLISLGFFTPVVNNTWRLLLWQLHRSKARSVRSSWFAARVYPFPKLFLDETSIRWKPTHNGGKKKNSQKGSWSDWASNSDLSDCEAKMRNTLWSRWPSVGGVNTTWFSLCTYGVYHRPHFFLCFLSFTLVTFEDVKCKNIQWH